MANNLSIRIVTFYLSCLIVMVTIGVIVIFQPENIVLDSWPSIIASVLIALLLSYLIAYFLLQRFVFKKVKSIYKLIHDHKLIPATGDEAIGKSTNDADLNSVSTEIEQWVEHTTEEISYLKNLEKYRRNFLGNISHELKTPIFSIQGYLHTLIDGGLQDEKINIKYLERAVANADRLQNIAEDLEIINTLESDAQALNFQIFDIKKLCEEVMIDLQFSAAEKKIEVSFEEGADQSYLVFADRYEIRQVLSNLLINAIKYNKKRGWVNIGLYDKGQRILIEVSDCGIGISDSHLKHVFDRFYRVHLSRSREMGGSGLGLSIVKHIIEAHDESISVRSTPNVGSCFGFTLKRHEA